VRLINHLDLFSGVGGFSLGLKEAGVQVGWHGFSDIDKHANKVFKRRFPNAKELGAVEHIKPNELPRINLITFGFPCQDLSIAGRRKGFDGSRSSLFFESIKIIEATKPQYFVFENVKGFFSSNDGKDFAIALRAVADIGYDGQWQLLNTRWFLPQNRERIYFVGHVRGECRPKVFPIEKFGAKNTCKDKVSEVHGIFKETERLSDAFRIRDTKGDSVTLKGLGGGMGAKTGLYKVGSRVRRLTPTECERLQGFPDGWTKGQSDTQRYKQMGNAVSVPVVKAVMKELNFK